MSHAIIDIGSNAIRSVVYEKQALGSPEIYNDKFKADINVFLSLENLEIPHPIYSIFNYFTQIFKQLNVTNIRCVATACLRNHPKKDIFIDLIKKKYDINIEVISGEKEAYLTALGLILGIKDACGIAADLGGGSLEFAEIENRQVGKIHSIALGTRILKQNPYITTTESIASAILTSFGGEYKYENLYLIGGAFRLIGKNYIKHTHYPLRNLHSLEIKKNDFIKYLDDLANITHFLDLSAILVLRALLEVFDSSKIIISNYGLKEGVYISSLPEQEWNKDIIYERSKLFTRFKEDQCKIDSYFELMKKFLINPDKLTFSIIRLAIMFTNMDIYVEKIFRGHFVTELILASDIPFSHTQRVMLAYILSITFDTKPSKLIRVLTRSILSRNDNINCRTIGSIINIIIQIDGPIFNEPSFTINNSAPYKVTINSPKTIPKIIFSRIYRELKYLSRIDPENYQQNEENNFMYNY